MFPADSLNPQYCEDQAAKYAARRLAVAQQAHSAASSATSSPACTRPPTPQPQSTAPHNPPQILPQRPNLSRPAPTGLLGNFFQGFTLAATNPPRDLQSKSAGNSPTTEKSEIEAMIAEKKRDADIVCMPTWYH